MIKLIKKVIEAIKYHIAERQNWEAKMSEPLRARPVK